MGGGWSLLVLVCGELMLGLGSGLAAQTPFGSIPEGVRRYDAYRASPGLRIDGRLNEAAWEAAPWTESFVDIRGEGHPVPTWETGAKLLWDDDFLYVAGYLEDPHVWATLGDRDAIIYRDNDFEVFLDPDGDALGYFEFEVNALGTLMDLYMNRPYNDGGEADLEWDARGVRWGVDVDGRLNDAAEEDRGWSVEMAIPWTSLVGARGGESGRPPIDGEVWRVNFSRVQWPLRVVDGRYEKVRESENWKDHPEHNWVWSPQGLINMHVPARWGAVTFRDTPPPGGHDEA
jgi:Carbohydrate family 9 binding domain-like